MDAAHRWEKEERTIWSRKGIVFILFCVLLSVLPSGAFAQSEPVTTGSSAIDTAYPPVPKAYFNDYAGVTSVKTQGVLKPDFPNELPN
jgi:hypothetical protein